MKRALALTVLVLSTAAAAYPYPGPCPAIKCEPPNSVPEPGTLLLLGIAGVGALVAKRNKK